MDACGPGAFGLQARGQGFESPYLHWSEARFENLSSGFRLVQQHSTAVKRVLLGASSPSPRPPFPGLSVICASSRLITTLTSQNALCRPSALPSHSVTTGRERSPPHLFRGRFLP